MPHSTLYAEFGLVLQRCLRNQLHYNLHHWLIEIFALPVLMRDCSSPFQIFWEFNLHTTFEALATLYWIFQTQCKGSMRCVPGQSSQTSASCSFWNHLDVIHCYLCFENYVHKDSIITPCFFSDIYSMLIKIFGEFNFIDESIYPLSCPILLKLT